MIRASTRVASTSMSDAFMATAERTCWSPTGPSAAYRPDRCEGRDARRRQEQAGLPEPPQTALSPIYHLRRFRSPNNEGRGARAWPHEEQHQKNTAPWSVQLLLCSIPLWWSDRASCRVQTAQHSGALFKSAQEEERKIKIVQANSKPCGWHERIGGLITAPPPVMCLKVKR